MNKTISINPDLFKFPQKSATRKNRKGSDNDVGKIKIKAPKIKAEDGKRTKRALLKYIRNKQENNLEKALSDQSKKAKNPIGVFNSDFAESLKYMTSVSQQHAPKNHNKTLKNSSFVPTLSGSSIFPNIDENVSLSLPNVFDLPLYNAIQPTTISINPTNTTKSEKYKAQNNPPLIPPAPIKLTGGNMVFPNTAVPQYGCLKTGGQLPTYRAWKNRTRNNHTVASNGGINIPSNDTNDISKRLSEVKQNIQTFKNLKPKPKGRYAIKQRRIARRTFRLGKSRHYPRVSVLVSNKTLRNNVTNKIHEIKQTPIQEVKKYLMKRGFIKIGTIAPNDVLRKMYESVSLICGEIKNHNPEILMYNYFNDVAR